MHCQIRHAYRGKVEAACSIYYPDQNHGHFLELVFLLSKYHNLHNHDEDVKNKRKAHHPNSRSGHKTLLSKTSVTICIPSSILKKHLSQDVREAVKFSVEMDSTRDVSRKESCIILLYFTCQRENSAGEAFLLKRVSCTIED